MLSYTIWLIHSNIINSFLYLLRGRQVTLPAHELLFGCTSLNSERILCGCVPWPPDHQDQADQLLYGLAPIWPHNQVSLPSISSTWGDRRKELLKIWVRAHYWDMWVQGEAEGLVCCLSFPAIWDEVSLGHAQTLKAGNASRSTSLNIASVCLICKASRERKISCRVLEKKPNKSMFALTINS